MGFSRQDYWSGVPLPVGTPEATAVSSFVLGHLLLIKEWQWIIVIYLKIVAWLFNIILHGAFCFDCFP